MKTAIRRSAFRLATLVTVLLVVIPVGRLVIATSRATTLQIINDSTNLILSWPTQAVGFKLQSSVNPGSFTNWIDVTNSPAVSGGLLQLTQSIAASEQYYRLAKAFAESPVLTNFAATATIPFNGSGAIQFSFGDPEADIVSLVTVRSNALGLFTNVTPAMLLSITGYAGQLSLPLTSSDLAFGDNLFTIQLKDHEGLLSAPVVFTTTLTGQGAGGAAPTIQNFAAQPAQWNRPAGVRDRLKPFFSFDFNDPDGDIERIRLKIVKPNATTVFSELSAQGLGVGGTSGTVSNQFLTLRNTDPLGTYTISMTLIDRNGHMSQPASVFLQLLFSGGAPPLNISSFTPTQGIAGTIIGITGTGFDASDPTNNQVLISTEEAAVSAVTPTTLTVVLPPVRGSGRIIVRNRNGSTASDVLFVVPPQVIVSPANSALPVGESLQFATEVISSISDVVNWSVNGIPGGDSTVGTISQSGIYVAPSNIPSNGLVTVTASLVSDQNVAGNATVEIGPPISTRGAATVLASVGGTVRSLDGRALVSFPPGVLANNTQVSVTVLHGTNEPPAAPGRRVISAVEFGPSGLTFTAPVTVTLPLVRAYSGGTQLPLKFFDPTDGTYTDDGVTAIVAANGNEATALLSHFSIAVLDDAAPSNPPGSPPTITSLTPNSGIEGMKVPVRITGTLLTEDLTPEIRTTAGAMTDDITPDTLYVGSTQAGVLLKINTIRDLGMGQTRIYKLRLARPGGLLFAEADFTVHGLPELDVAPGQTVTMTGSNIYSEVTVAGPTDGNPNVSTGIVKVLTPPPGAPPFFIGSMGRVMINGIIDGSGAPGGNAFGIEAGAAPSGGQGGAGGRGRDDSGCTRVLGVTVGSGPDDCAPAFAYGQDGNLTGTDRFHHRFGFGGAPGKTTHIVDDIVSGILDAIECVVGDIASCVQLVGDIIEIADDVNGLEENATTGRKGLAAGGLAEHGGGGGGGGGNNVGFLSADLNGGGGGAGGDGGHEVTILTGDTLSLNGMVTTAGGNGGNGSAVSLLGPVTLSDSDNLSVDGGFVGGGGGGGSGARLEIGSAETPNVRFQANVNHADFDGGKGGLGGITVTHKDGIAFHMTFRSTHGQNGPFGNFLAYGPAFDPTVFRTMVTSRNLLRVRGLDRTDLSYQGGPPTIMIVGEQPGQVRTVQAFLGPDSHWAANLVLFPGFNTFPVQNQNPILDKTILVMSGPDSDGDGLSDADEVDLGTDPNKSDTDNDGLSDMQEVLVGGDPTNPDSDGDGLTDGQEAALGTSPTNPDTDGDGYSDSVEVFLGSDPKSATSVPDSIPDGTLYAASTGTGGGQFLTLINTNTGAVGLLGRPNGGLGFGLAFDTLDRLYIARFSDLAIYDPLTDTIGSVGPYGSGGGNTLHALTLAYCPTNDSLYGVELGPAPEFAPTGQLLQIDPVTGAGTRIGAPGPNAIDAITFSLDGKCFAAMAVASGSDHLVKLDPRTGTVVQDIGSIGLAPIFGMAFTADGILYGSYRLSDNQSQLLIINTNSGQAAVATTVNRGVFGLATTAYQPLGASIASANPQKTVAGRGLSLLVDLSADGRVVAFNSQATNLTTIPITDLNPSSVPHPYNVFTRDILAPQAITRLVTVNTQGTASVYMDPQRGGSYANSLSADGRYLAFTSSATNLVALPTYFGGNIYRHDLLNNVTELVSVNYGGTAGANTFSTSSSRGALMSADGRWVAFSSTDTNLVQPRPTSALYNVYARDMQAGVTVLVSHNLSITNDGNQSSWFVDGVSANGKVVAFESLATDLVAVDDTNNTADLFAYDLQTGVMHLITMNSSGSGAGNHGWTGGSSVNTSVSISVDGRYVAFHSASTDLVNLTDTNNLTDIFVRDLQAETTRLVSVTLGGTAAGSSGLPSMSADGRFVVFASTSTNLVSVTDTNALVGGFAYAKGLDVFVRNLQSGTTRLVSINQSGTAAGNGGSTSPVISADGRRVAFISFATDLVTSPAILYPNQDNIYVRDLVTGTTTLLTPDSAYTHGVGGGSIAAQVKFSSDGTVVAFTCTSTNLVRINETNYAPGFTSEVYFKRLAP